MLFETLAYFIASQTYFIIRRRFADTIPTPIRWAIVAAATSGAVFGSKLLYWLEDPKLTLLHLHDPVYLMGGKTIVGALIGGLFAVEWAKHGINVHRSTGDLFAIPLAIGIVVGRIGCFLTGLDDNTYGDPTNLPWGVDFGDGIPRHPTQIYEILFALVLIPLLFLIMRRIEQPENRFQSGDAFKVFMVAYLTFRLICDAIKPYPHIAIGLGTIQWACICMLIYYYADIIRWISADGSNLPQVPNNEERRESRA